MTFPLLVDENAPSFTTREEYNKILKDMGFNRTRI